MNQRFISLQLSINVVSTARIINPLLCAAIIFIYRTTAGFEECKIINNNKINDEHGSTLINLILNIHSL